MKNGGERILELLGESPQLLFVRMNFYRCTSSLPDGVETLLLCTLSGQRGVATLGTLLYDSLNGEMPECKVVWPDPVSREGLIDLLNIPSHRSDDTRLVLGTDTTTSGSSGGGVKLGGGSPRVLQQLSFILGLLQGGGTQGLDPNEFRLNQRLRGAINDYIQSRNRDAAEFGILV